MKRIILFFVFGILLLASSCKKDYTCECTTENPLGGNDFVIPHQIENSKKKQAETACLELEAETDNTTCVLK